MAGEWPPMGGPPNRPSLNRPSAKTSRRWGMGSKKRAIVQQVVGKMGRAVSASDFDSLVRAIVQVHEQLQFKAAKAVDIHLTLRNWLIGCRIREYELKGKDRAAYGEKLFGLLSEKLARQGVSNCDRRQLYRYRDFYLAFPKIVGTVSPQLLRLLPGKILPVEKVGTASPQLGISSEDILNRLSYSHLEELTELDDPLKRAFYEVECLRGNWSVRELKRQIASLYYERAGLSKNKKKISELTQAKAEPQTASQIIRDPYVFEFLGLKPKEVVGESDVEDALAGIDNRLFVSKYQLELPKKEEIRKFIERQMESAASEEPRHGG